MRGAVTPIVVLGALALPGAASADVWVGKTNQGLRGVVETNPDGSIKVVKVRYLMRCRPHGFDLGGQTGWVSTAANPIERDGAAFSDSGPANGRLRGGYRVKGTLTLAGRFLANGKVSVRQTNDLVITRRGKRFDACKGTFRFLGTKR